jgi:heptosyltransferase-2/heptosyltransferase-3
MSGSPRPLVVRFGAMGDMVNLTALLRALAVAWGRPCDVVTGRGAPERVLRGLDSVGEVRALDGRRTPYPLSPEQWRLVGWLRGRAPGPTYLIDPKPKGEAKLAWLLARGGVPPAHRIAMRDRPRGDLEHVVDYLLRLGRVGPPVAAGIPRRPFPEPPPGPEIAVSADERADGRRWLAGLGWAGEPLILVQTEARRRNRGRWPAARWREVIGAVLAELPGAWALLVGAPSERPRTSALAAACDQPHARGRVRDVAGDLPLRRLFALFTHAHSCLSLDTGPAHAAAALGCPVVVLMGRADPRRNRPFGPPETVRVVAAWPEERWPATSAEWRLRHDMAEIEVDAVVAAWRRLAGSATSRAGLTAAAEAAAKSGGRR